METNYTVLYRKYRPETLEEVVGRKTIIETLQNAIKLNQLSHAYLFCGPRGTGKTSLARIFAKEINGGFVEDIIEIDAASNNGVDEVRNLIDRVKFAPIKGKYKIYIIDEVHMLTTGAANAFLKTIEEPPQHVIFILATTEPHKIIETILSRCQRYDFKPFLDEEIAKHLKFVCNQENITVTDNAIIEITKLANGGMRDALSILDQLATFSNKNIDVKNIESLYGTISNHLKEKLVDKLLLNDEPLKFVQETFLNKNLDYKLLFQDILELIKTKMLNNYNIDKKKCFYIVDEILNVLSKIMVIKNHANYFELFVLKIMNYQSINTVAVENTIQNQIVSRETLKIDPYIKEKNNIDYNKLLSYLVSANKEYKISLKEKIEKNKTDILLKKQANFIKYLTGIEKFEIIATNTQFIMFNVGSSNIKDVYLKTIKQDDFKTFIYSVFEKNYEILILDNAETKQLLENYRTCRDNNTLPKPIEIVEVATNFEIEETSLEKMKKVFKDKLKIKEI